MGGTASAFAKAYGHVRAGACLARKNSIPLEMSAGYGRVWGVARSSRGFSPMLPRFSCIAQPGVAKATPLQRLKESAWLRNQSPLFGLGRVSVRVKACTQLRVRVRGRLVVVWNGISWISRVESAMHGGHSYLRERIFEVAISSKKSRHKVEFGRRVTGKRRRRYLHRREE